MLQAGLGPRDSVGNQSGPQFEFEVEEVDEGMLRAGAGGRRRQEQVAETEIWLGHDEEEAGDEEMWLMQQAAVVAAGTAEREAERAVAEREEARRVEEAWEAAEAEQEAWEAGTYSRPLFSST